MNWNQPPPRWDTLAGRVLDTFFASIHKALPDYPHPLTVFGSAPIQLCLDEDFASGDVDVMALEGGEVLRRIAAESGVGRAGTIRASHGIQICPPLLFRPTPHYLQRAHIEIRHGLKIIIPHLRDILIAKLHRSRHEGQQGLVPKDLRAFSRVRQLSGGHPTLAELLEDLTACESCFRPPQDGSVNAFRLNAEDVLLEIYQHPLDLKRDILEPATRLSQHPDAANVGRVADMLQELKTIRSE